MTGKTRTTDSSSTDGSRWKGCLGTLAAVLVIVVAAWLGIDLDGLPVDLPFLTPEAPVVVAPAPDAGEAPGAVPGEIPAGAVRGTVIRAIDGDTAEVLVDGEVETIRYVGIDTPERGEPGYKAATRANDRLLDEDDVYLVRDRSDRDRYGRLLRFLYKPDGTFINRQMIARGYAQPIEYTPDVTFAKEFRDVAAEAAATQRGFWSGSAEPDDAMPYALTRRATDLRTAPGTDQAVQMNVPAQTPLTVYGRDRSGRWLQVRTPDRAGGWVLADAVTLNVPPAQVAVTAETSGVVEPTPSAARTVALEGNAIDGVALRVVTNSGSDELLELTNQSGRNVIIGGWQISGSRGTERCVIPAETTLRRGELYRVASGRTPAPENGFKCSGAFLWSNEGETIYLQSPEGERIAIDAAP